MKIKLRTCIIDSDERVEIPVPFVHCFSLQSRAIKTLNVGVAAIVHQCLFPNLKRTFYLDECKNRFLFYKMGYLGDL